MLHKNNEFTQLDIKMYRALRSVVSKGRYEITGDAVGHVAQIWQWLAELEPKIERGIVEANARALADKKAKEKKQAK